MSFYDCTKKTTLVCLRRGDLRWRLFTITILTTFIFAQATKTTLQRGGRHCLAFVSRVHSNHPQLLQSKSRTFQSTSTFTAMASSDETGGFVAANLGKISCVISIMEFHCYVIKWTFGGLNLKHGNMPNILLSPNLHLPTKNRSRIEFNTLENPTASV